MLAGRNDIDVYYWIDGLGVEWIPFIQAILAKHQQDNIYLNEVMVARALLPTTTEINKVELQHLSDVDIQTMKVGIWILWRISLVIAILTPSYQK